MASETITRNDLTAILNEVLPQPNTFVPNYSEMITVSSLPYTAPSTGVIMYSIGDGSGSGETNLLINGTEVGRSRNPAGERTTITALVAKDDIVSSAGAIWGYIHFIPMREVITPAPNVVDYIVEQGTSDIWTYRKWNSGIAECWGKHTATLSRYATFGPFYGYNTSVAFPSNLFVSAPIHTYTASVSSTFAMPASGIGTSATSTALYTLAAIDGTYECSFEIIAKGRWK